MPLDALRLSCQKLTFDHTWKYDQKSTFDRKVLESPIFNQNDCNRNFKRFLYVRGHFALKCVLSGLIDQLVILRRIS